MNLLITIPVYNEEKSLKKNILYLNNYLKKNIPYNYLIEIVDNNSSDKTLKIGKELSKNKNISCSFLKKQGKGYAIKFSWDKANKKYNIFSFMDVDLATDLSSFKELIDAIYIEKYDLSIGSRYEKKSEVKRSFKRSFFAKGYFFFQKILFNIDYKDSQCGFKAIKRDAYFSLKPYFFKKKLFFDKTDMFFDTELLILSKRIFNYKIKSIPVKWVSGKDSKVKIFKIILIFLINLILLKFSLVFKK
jgi:glycosyltransferase AglD